MPRRFSRSVHASSVKHDWRTPKSLVALVRSALNGTIDLDPCAGARTKIGRRNVTAARDGLSIPWSGSVYVNPPYGRALAHWIAKAIEESARSRTRGALTRPRDRAATPPGAWGIIVLIPARTDTRAFHAAAAAASSACLLRGRLRFIGAPAPAPFPSVLFYFGSYPARFDAVFASHGLITRFAPSPGRAAAARLHATLIGQSPRGGCASVISRFQKSAARRPRPPRPA